MEKKKILKYLVTDQFSIQFDKLESAYMNSFYILLNGSTIGTVSFRKMTSCREIKDNKIFIYFTPVSLLR